MQVHHDVNIELKYCFDHVEIVRRLSDLFKIESGDSVNLNIHLNPTNGFVYPDYLLLIISAIHRLRNIKVEIGGTVHCSNPNIFDYISRMDFFRYLDVKNNEGFARQKSKGRFLEISKFDETNVHGISSVTMEILTKKVKADKTVLMLLDYCMNEIVDNVINHSREKNGWIVAQSYPKNIRVLISDTGIGIHESLKKKYPDWSPEKAILKSIEKSITSGIGMGNGLYFTTRYIEENDGEMILYSGYNYVRVDKNGINLETDEFWKGTFLFLNVKCNNKVDFRVILGELATLEDDYNERFGFNEGLW